MKGVSLEFNTTGRLVALVMIVMLLSSGFVLATVQHPAKAAFPGQNGALSFSRETEAQCGDTTLMNAMPVFRIDSDGSREVRLSDPCTTTGVPPAWSPDGQKVAFGRYPDWDVTGDHYDLWSMDSNGSAPVRITNTPHEERSVTWFPSGRKIAFTVLFGGEVYLQPLGPDGTQSAPPKVLTTNEGANIMPAVSPAGGRIAVSRTSKRSPNDFGIVLLKIGRREGPNNRPVALTRNNGIDDYAPAWSPDGKKIAFSSDRDNLDFEIYVMRAVTEGPNNVPDALTNNSQNDFFPDWQPLP